MWSWQIIAGVAATWVAVGSVIGFALMTRRAEEETSPPWSRRKKALLFFAGFLGWPIILCGIIFLVWMAWGYPDIKDDDKDR